jgi:hypothetical protein
MMTILFPNGEHAVMTEAQRVAVINLAQRFNLGDTVEVHTFFGDEAIMLEVAGMWFGIETDGYAHT